MLCKMFMLKQIWKKKGKGWKFWERERERERETKKNCLKLFRTHDVFAKVFGVVVVVFCTKKKFCFENV